MLKLILLLLLFSLSLLVLFRAPTSLLWYLSILVTEFSWIFIVITGGLLFWQGHRYPLLCNLLGAAAILFFLLPYWQAWRLSRRLPFAFQAAFNPSTNQTPETPFQPHRVFTGIGAKKIKPSTIVYDKEKGLTLDFYTAQKKGLQPCVLIIHGGSWAGGDSKQLADLNSEMTQWGYHVASLNYRLAPQFHFPAPLEDVHTALQFLQSKAVDFSLDPSRFVLLGRSAGGQIALSAAYQPGQNAIKGVIDFYGPTDMVWGYAHPTNPLVLDSRKVMEDYLGGTYEEVPEQYRSSSATEVVNSQTPPTLLIYAENDPLVSPRHGNRLSVRLRQAKVPYFELYLPWATHAFDYTLNGPGGQLSTWAVKQFLDAILDKKQNTD